MMIRFARSTAFFLLYSIAITSADRLDGRYSFSLTTFDPQGKLAQVERATLAASLGTPVIGVCCQHGVYLCAPQLLPSPLIIDDGTARFVTISKKIAITHSGIDGRIVLAAAQRMAVEYEFTYDEEMPIDAFLEEISLLFQEYTMKAGCRPFGCSILAAHFDDESGNHCLYRIDPSGAVGVCGSSGMIGSAKVDFLSKIKQHNGSAEVTVQDLVQIMKDCLETLNNFPSTERPKMTYLTAKLTKDGLSIERQEKEKITNSFLASP